MVDAKMQELTGSLKNLLKPDGRFVVVPVCRLCKPLNSFSSDNEDRFFVVRLNLNDEAVKPGLGMPLWQLCKVHSCCSCNIL